MRTSGNGSGLCHKAKEYYYELLCHDSQAVPEVIARHVEGCSYCQEQIRRLQDTLLEFEGSSEPPAEAGNPQTVESLSRQFELLGQPVRCSHVKPFLPDLLTPAPEIRIPTPITVHVENCPACMQDLASIRGLGLTGSQLKRLGRFLEQPALEDPSCDRPAHPTATALAAFSLDGADPETLDHISRCPSCRTRLYDQRARVLADRNDRPDENGVLLCREITTADLFDYVLPFGLDAATLGRPDGRRDAVATHLRTCRVCLEKVQSLHQKIYQIADRADSAVGTIYTCNDEWEDTLQEAQPPAYRYPVNIQILRTAPAAGEPSLAFAQSERHPGIPHKRRLLLRGTAITTVAAAIVVAVILLIPPTTATGMSAGDVLKNVTHAANFHLIRYAKDESQPIFEMWVSTPLKKIAKKTSTECYEYDLKTGYEKMIVTGMTAAVSRKLKDSEQEQCRLFVHDIMRGIFTGFSGDLADAELSEVDSDSVASDRSGVAQATYELTKESFRGNGSVSYRWKVYMDRQLELPVRIECSCHNGVELVEKPTVWELTYPTTAEMQEVFKGLWAGN